MRFADGWTVRRRLKVPGGQLEGVVCVDGAKGMYGLGQRGGAVHLAPVIAAHTLSLRPTALAVVCAYTRFDGAPWRGARYFRCLRCRPAAGC